MAAQQQAMVKQMMEHQTLQAVTQIERAIDDQLQSLDNLTDSDIDKLRKKRRREMMERAAKMGEWRRLGHGTYHEIGDQADWFKEAKTNERLITHFHRPTTWRCEIVDKHLEKLAPKHMETRIIKINAEKAPFLAERMNIVVLPCIIITKDNTQVDRIEGFDELGATDKFSTRTLEKRLAKNGGLDIDPDEMDDEDRLAPQQKTYNKENRSGAAVYQSKRQWTEADLDALDASSSEDEAE